MWLKQGSYLVSGAALSGVLGGTLRGAAGGRFVPISLQLEGAGVLAGLVNASLGTNPGLLSKSGGDALPGVAGAPLFGGKGNGRGDGEGGVLSTMSASLLLLDGIGAAGATRSGLSLPFSSLLLH